MGDGGHYLHRGKSRSHHKSQEKLCRRGLLFLFLRQNSKKLGCHDGSPMSLSSWSHVVPIFLFLLENVINKTTLTSSSNSHSSLTDWLTHQTQFYIILHTQSGTPTVTDLYSLIDAFSLEYKYENTLMKTIRVMKCLRTVFVNAFITMALFVSNQFSRPLGRRYHLFCQ